MLLARPRAEAAGRSSTHDLERPAEARRDFERWANEGQLAPKRRRLARVADDGRARIREDAGGRGVDPSAGEGAAGVRIALVGATIADARSIMVEGVSGMLKIARTTAAS